MCYEKRNNNLQNMDKEKEKTNVVADNSDHIDDDSEITMDDENWLSTTYGKIHC